MDWIRDTGLALSILGFVGVGGALVFAVLRLAYAFSPAARARRAMQRAIRGPRRLLASIEEAFADRARLLDAASRRFLAAQQAARASAVPVEALKVDGRVPAGALREAGFASLAEVAGATEGKLAGIRAVGAAHAARLAGAARAALERIEHMPPDMPTAELAEPGAVAVGREALEILRIRDAVHAAHAQVKAEFASIAEEADEMRRESRFARWLLRRAHGPDEAPGERAYKCADRVAELRGGDAFLKLSTAWKVFPRRHKRAKDDEVREHVGLRYAEVCAICAESFARLGHPEARRSAAAQGALPEEIIGRVATFPLDCDGLDVELRGYQKLGAQFILEQKRTVLGDETGLGKTIEALAAMTHRWSEHPARRFLVVAPAALVSRWARESRPRVPFPVHVLRGDELPQALAKWRAENGLAITSVAALRSLAREDAERFEEIDGIDLAVVDDAHELLDPDSDRTRAALAVVARAGRVALMTGTPPENRPAAFLSLIRIARPAIAAMLDAGGDFEDEAFDVLGRPHERFRETVSTVYLRRTQQDVLSELPECIEIDEWVDLGDAARAYARAVADGDFAAMRRATAVAEPGARSGKLDRLEELLVDHVASGRKVVVFSCFDEVLAAIDERFGALGRLTRETTPKDRAELVDAFRGIPGHTLLLCHVEMAAQGLNLQCATAVVLVEPQLEPTSEDHAVARAHRMGQTQAVLVHRLLAYDTLDEHLAARLARRRELFDAFTRETSSGASETAHAAFASEVIEKERERLELRSAAARRQG